MEPTVDVAEVFVAMADTLVADFDLVEFLQSVTVNACTVSGAAACGLLLADLNGQLQFMAASDERTELLELFQVQQEEGPCRDAYLQGAAVINADLRRARWRWPAFAEKAVTSGFLGVHAFPMRLREQVIGAVNLFSDTTGGLDDDAARVVQALADVATIGLLQERAVRRSEVLAEQLQGALTSRIVIEQAKGAIAQAYDVSTDEAFDLLRAYCRRGRLRLSEVAQAVAGDPQSIPPLRDRPTT